MGHTYTHTSGPGGYAVTARLVFRPAYTVNGIPGPTIETIAVPVSRTYAVRQIQAVRRD